MFYFSQPFSIHFTVLQSNSLDYFPTIINIHFYS